jgi:hypothetical protein
VSTSNPTPYWIRSFSGPPGVTISPPVTPKLTVWQQIREYFMVLYR